MEVFVTRHGQTNWNLLGKIQGRTDIELNDTGRAQAEETGNLMKNNKIDLIITSPLKRAKETAEIINKNFNVEILEDVRLMERGFGKSEGLTKTERSELKTIYPEVEYIWDYNKNVDFNEIEKMQEFCNRIYEFLDEITEKYKGKNILLVTHGGSFVIIKCYFTKFPLKQFIDRDSMKGIGNCEFESFSI